MKQIDVLIVEDDLPLQEAIEDTLVNYGYRTHCVENGVEALKALESNHARLVISDVQMKQMDGIQLLQELKSKFPSLPVLLMTAHATVEKAVHSIKAGATDYLTKPFTKDQLLQAVRQFGAVMQGAS